jgi:hypothetical protein
VEDSSEHGNERSGSIKCWEPAQLEASQEGFSFMSERMSSFITHTFVLFPSSTSYEIIHRSHLPLITRTNSQS